MRYLKSLDITKGKRIKATVIVLSLLIVWEFFCRMWSPFGTLLPAPTDIAYACAGMIQEKNIITDISVSILRMISGFFIATVIGIVLGTTIGVNNKISEFTNPIIQILKPIPSVALIPIAILFLGIGNIMKIFIICYAALWPILINTIDGIKNVDAVQIETGKMLGLNRQDIILRIMLPNAISFIFAGLKISAPISLILTVTSEMVGSTNGIGHSLLLAQRSFMIPELFALIGIIGCIGFLFNKIILAIEKTFTGWKEC